MVTIVCVTVVITAVNIEKQMACKVDLQSGVEHEEHGIAHITLRIGVFKVVEPADTLLIIAFPCPYLVEVGTQRESGETSELYHCLHLGRESAAQVVVAFHYVEVVGKRDDQFVTGGR